MKLTYKKLSRIFKSLSDETRLKVVALLIKRKRLCECDIVKALGITQTKASRHLRYLLNAGLVTDLRAGRWVHYKIDLDRSESTRLLKVISSYLQGRELKKIEEKLDEWLRKKEISSFSCPASPEVKKFHKLNLKNLKSGRK